jgi:hypothetical protein
LLLARPLRFALTALLFCLTADSLSASAFIRGAYYRLGDDDPGAAPNATGNNPTRDSFGDAQHLTRFGSQFYQSNVPPSGPQPNKLSMSFQIFTSTPGSGQLGYYGRNESLSMIEQGYALEAWVQTSTFFDGPTPSQLIAYNGDPAANGFGLYRTGSDYVARIGTFERKLAPANDSEWHHLAYVQSLGTSSYYFDGALVAETDKDPLPIAATGGFWLAGRSIPTGAADLFEGAIDEVRYQSFNPMAAGAFEPTNFLITPEPGAATLLLCAGATLLHRRKRA